MIPVSLAPAGTSAGRLSARAVVTAVFFAFAIGLGLWAGSIPALMRQAGLDVAGLGIALTLHTGAYIAAMAGGGQLARIVAPRRLMLGSLIALAPCFGLLFLAASPVVLMTALVALGLSAGLLDLAMNAEGTAVALPVALALHRLGLRLHAPVAPLAVPGRGGAGHGVAVIGVVLGLTISAEMAAQMWSARFLERQAADLAAFAGAGAAFFAGFQAVVRLLGDTLRRRFGDARVIGASLVVAALGFALVASSAWFVQSLLGFALVGLGTACVVPCCFALIARRAAERAAAALGVASLIAGAIRLPTPLLLGAVAASYSEAHAFAGVALGLGLALALARRATNERL